MMINNFNTPTLLRIYDIFEFSDYCCQQTIYSLQEVLTDAPLEFINELSKSIPFKNFLSAFYCEVYLKNKSFNIGFNDKQSFSVALNIVIRHTALNLVSSFMMLRELDFKNILDQWMNGTKTWAEHKDNEGNYQDMKWIDDLKQENSDAFTTSGSKDQSKTRFGSEMYSIKTNFDSKPLMLYNKIITEFDKLFVVNYDIEWGWYA